MEGAFRIGQGLGMGEKGSNLKRRPQGPKIGRGRNRFRAGTDEQPHGPRHMAGGCHQIKRGLPQLIPQKLGLIRSILGSRLQDDSIPGHPQIEGDLHEGQHAILVEDLTTDGASKVNFCKALRDAGTTVEHALVVFFYGVFPGALRTLEDMGITLHYLANWWDVLEVAEQGKYFDAKTLQEVREFLHDPIDWSTRHGGRSE